MWEMPMHRMHATPSLAFLLGLQPRVSVLRTKPSGLGDLHVSSEGRFLPLHWWGRGRLLRGQTLLLCALELLRTLVLHGSRFIGSALPGVLFTSHWLCQAFAEMLRWHQPPRMSMQKHPILQSGRNQGLSAGKTSIVMVCRTFFPKSWYLRCWNQ